MKKTLEGYRGGSSYARGLIYKDLARSATKEEYESWLMGYLARKITTSEDPSKNLIKPFLEWNHAYYSGLRPLPDYDGVDGNKSTIEIDGRSIEYSKMPFLVAFNDLLTAKSDFFVEPQEGVDAIGLIVPKGINVTFSKHGLRHNQLFLEEYYGPLGLISYKTKNVGGIVIPSDANLRI